jgi:hypothetical protein
MADRAVGGRLVRTGAFDVALFALANFVEEEDAPTDEPTESAKIPRVASNSVSEKTLANVIGSVPGSPVARGNTLLRPIAISFDTLSSRAV